MASQLSQFDSTLASLARNRPDMWSLSACGLTPAQEPIPSLLHRDAYSVHSAGRRVLLIAGLSGSVDDTMLALQVLKLVSSNSAQVGSQIAISAIPNANPQAAKDLSSPYPPLDGFFNHGEEPEKRYLWRYICWQAPGLVLEIRAGTEVTWQANPAAGSLVTAWSDVKDLSEPSSLLAVLGIGKPEGLGAIPGLRLTCPDAELTGQIARLWKALELSPPGRFKSPARLTLDDRRSRSFLEVANDLAQTYGHQLDPVNYTQGVGISGRLRLHQLDPSGPSPVNDIVRLVEPYVSGETPMFSQSPGGANLAGLVWADELYQETGDLRYRDLIIHVAHRYQPARGQQAPNPCDPEFRTEDMFMAGAMLGRAYALTGDTRYTGLLVKFLLDAGTQQDNGMFWHCRSAPYYWGRGNGFAALGLSETLTHLPDDHPGREEIIGMYRMLLDGVAATQNMSGMYPQVLNVPGSYQEFTATCMMGIALARGLRLGWLGPDYRPALELAWQGVAERTDDQGNVVDGCSSTGVQGGLQEYLDRPAIFGRDDRSGGMALWFAVEMERCSRAR